MAFKAKSTGHIKDAWINNIAHWKFSTAGGIASIPHLHLPPRSKEDTLLPSVHSSWARAAATTCDNYCQLWQLFLWRGTSVYIKSGWGLQTHSQRPLNTHQLVKITFPVKRQTRVPKMRAHIWLTLTWPRLKFVLCVLRNPCSCWQMGLHLKSLPLRHASWLFGSVNIKNMLPTIHQKAGTRNFWKRHQYVLWMSHHELFANTNQTAY